MAKNSKNNKKERKINKIEYETAMDSSIKNKIFIVIGILVFLLAFYLLTLYITNKNNPKKEDSDTKEEVTFSYDEILLGRSLSMQDDEYLVLFYDKSDEKQSEIYDQLYKDYKNKEEHLSIYYVDMSSGLNKKFSTTEESNKNPSDVSEFLINGPTLIRVNNHIVQDYYEGEESIKSIIQ